MKRTDMNIMNTSYGIIWKILNVLDLSLDLDEVPLEQLTAKRFGITQNRFESYMNMLQNAGYITGVEYEDDITTEKPKLDLSNVSITLEGIEFLIENRTMSKITANAKQFGLVAAEASITTLIDRIASKM